MTSGNDLTPPEAIRNGRAMPTPTKFTRARSEVVLELLGAGALRTHAARVAGVDPATLYRWLVRGRKALPGSRSRAFSDAVAEAEEDPRLGALKAEHERRLDNPVLAFRWLERRGEFAPEPVARGDQAYARRLRAGRRLARVTRVTAATF